MPDLSQFRHSDNIEDRREEVLPAGVFGASFIDAPQNVFERSGGLLTSFDANTDFHPTRRPSGLARQAGVNDIKLTPVDHDPFTSVLVPVDYDPFLAQ